MPEPETIIVHVDERTRREAEAILRPFGLTASQLFSLLIEVIAHDQGFAGFLVKSTASPPPIVPNAETVEAMEATRRGELSGPFSSVDELMAHLHGAQPIL